MKWRIEGVHRKTGAKVDPFTVEADSEDDALSLVVAERPVMVTSIAPCNAPTPPCERPRSKVPSKLATPQDRPEHEHSVSTSTVVLAIVALVLVVGCAFMFYTYEQAEQHREKQRSNQEAIDNLKDALRDFR